MIEARVRRPLYGALNAALLGGVRRHECRPSTIERITIAEKGTVVKYPMDKILFRAEFFCLFKVFFCPSVVNTNKKM